MHHADRACGERRIFRAVPRGAGECGGPDKAGVREVGQPIAAQAERAVGWLGNNSQRRTGRPYRDSQIQRRIIRCAARSNGHRGGRVGVAGIAARSFVTRVATDDRAAEKGLGAEGAQGAVGLHPRKHRAAIIGSMTCLALCRTGVVDKIRMRRNPCRSHGMHSVWSADVVGWRGRVARRAFHHHARVTLNFDIANIVVHVGAGKFRMG